MQRGIGCMQSMDNPPLEVRCRVCVGHSGDQRKAWVIPGALHKGGRGVEQQRVAGCEHDVAQLALQWAPPPIHCNDGSVELGAKPHGSHGLA